ncbi:galactose-6-phosphate isomerase subunit LacA [[Collinsella] massiliensis]|uniref:Galactose-6-phosphate isomerase subunit LacA n=1 Tax=[Collinsella] massiliensis TaxID=1232426 RepID=A0A1Y3XZV4_9ACTN|nr:galactose-6-phosphate isomerase subunit LacA [[Collinsella] massiliensis]OUN87560.1 galactose-6-phosphate isomerase subunit LacA [[Collinsella] massiliensis]
MNVVLAADVFGVELKEVLAADLRSRGWDVVDLSPEPVEDGVEAAVLVARAVQASDESLGIVCDAYGVESYLAATKMKGMVAAALSDERTAHMTREHNDARVICLGAQIVGSELARNIVFGFLTGTYSGGRHQARVDMLKMMGSIEAGEVGR